MNFIQLTGLTLLYLYRRNELNKKNVSDSNSEKKQYLEQYQEIKSELSRLDYKIKELRSLKLFPAVFYDGMPRGTQKSDLSDYVAKLDELVNEYNKLRYHRLLLFEKICSDIEHQEDELERQVLFERYIKCKKWEMICSDMGYSWQHIHRIHTKAIKNFKM